MQEDFFIGFDNDMDDFQNAGGKEKRQARRTARKERRAERKASRKGGGAMPTETPTGTPIDMVTIGTPIEETMAGAMTTQASAEAGAGMVDTRTTTGTTGADTTGLSMTTKIAIGVGALVLIGGAIFFATRK